MAVKGLILFYFRLTPHKSYLELQLQLPGSEPVEQQPTEGLGLGSVIHSLRRPGFMGLNLITRPKRQPTKSNNTLYLALLLLCAGDIETNPGPTNIITCSVVLLLLYITLNGPGCDWTSSFSLATPVMVFSRQSNSNGSGGGAHGGHGGGEETGQLTNADTIAIVVPLVVALIGLPTAIILTILAIWKCLHCDQSADITIEIEQVEPNEEMIEVGGKVVLKCHVKSKIYEYISQGLSYKWFKVGSEEVTLSEVETLEIDEFKPGCEGEYRCIVTFKRSCTRWAHLKKTETYTLQKIKGEAEITPNPPTFSLGDEVTLTCSVKNVSAVIKLRYKWLRKGLGNTEYSTIEEGTKNTTELSSLRIDDKGTYRCEVTYDHDGYEEWSITSNPEFVVDFEEPNYDGNPVDDCANHFNTDQIHKNCNAAEDQWPPPSHVANIHKFIRLEMKRAENTLMQGKRDDSPVQYRQNLLEVHNVVLTELC